MEIYTWLSSNLYTWLFCHFLWGILCFILARSKGRSTLLWFLLAIPLGLLPLFILLVLDPVEKPATQQPPAKDGGLQ